MMQTKITYDSWVEENYNPIVLMLKSRCMLNEDALHDALLSLYDKWQNNMSITHSELSTLFEEEYRRYDKKAFFAIKQYLHFEPQVLDLIVSSNVEEECEHESPDNKSSLKKICSSLRRISMSLRLSEDYEMLVLYETDELITLKSLSNYMGIPQGTIYGKLQRIKKILRCNYLTA